MTINLSIGELELVLEALAYRAGRHESMARVYPHIAGPHDRKAEAMRALATKLKKRD